MKNKLAILICIALLLQSCKIVLYPIYFIYPGKPKEKDFKYINPTVSHYNKNTCNVNTEGYYIGKIYEDDLAFYKFVIFFPDGRFCLDYYAEDSTYISKYIKIVYDDYKKAQFYGYFYCNQDTVRAEYVSEVRDGLRNNYYMKEFNVKDSSTIYSNADVSRRSGRAFKTDDLLYLKQFPW
jgi:hypothetical protein